MLATGIVITIVAILMILFPEFFIKLKSPRIPEKILKNPKMKSFVVIWGIVCAIIGILLTGFAFV